MKHSTATQSDALSEAKFDISLAQIIDFGPEYGAGLSNHAPMALETLASLGLVESFDPYVKRVSPTLEPVDEPYRSTPDWKSHLDDTLPGLLHKAGSQAGHGLLRVAHAVRSLGRHDSEIRRRELAAALQYWDMGVALDSPEALTGSRATTDVFADLPRLRASERPDGLLVVGLQVAMGRPRVLELLQSIAPANNIASAFDQLALLACEAFLINHGICRFTLLHGVTVSTMARELLPYLDERGQRRLESAVTGFVAAAAIGFNDGDALHEPQTIPEAEVERYLETLIRRAADGKDDHDIKFAGAASQLARRTGSLVPVHALLSALG